MTTQYEFLASGKCILAIVHQPTAGTAELKHPISYEEGTYKLDGLTLTIKKAEVHTIIKVSKSELQWTSADGSTSKFSRSEISNVPKKR